MKISRRKLISYSVLLFFIILIIVFRYNPSWGEFYAKHIYPYMAIILSSLSNWLPFSVGDVFILGVSIYLIILLYKLLFKKKRKGHRLYQIIITLGWIYVWFYLAWGLNYFRPHFYTRTAITYTPYQPEYFKNFVANYIEKLNESYTPDFYPNIATLKNEVVKGYNEIRDTFGIIKPQGGLKVKKMLISLLMSKMGVIGYMGPFLCEFNVNGDVLPDEYPAVYAHELAHRLSITNEAEANLYAYLVCTRSDNQAIRYSGYASLLGYVVGNARSLLSEEEYKIFLNSIRQEVKDDFNNSRKYWRDKYSPLLADIQEYIYNLFLKSNQISSGTKNYSEVIGLLMSYENYKKTELESS